MSSVEERSAIGTLFNVNWGSTTPVAWPGVKFTPPEDDNWVRLVFGQFDAFHVEMGPTNAQERAVGLIIVQVFTPLGRGDKTALELADQVTQIFRYNKRVAAGEGDVRFRAPIVGQGGVDAEGLYYQVNVSIPYAHDSVN